MRIIKELQNWDMESVTSMHMIIRNTMWNNSIFLMELNGKEFYRLSNNGYEKSKGFNRILTIYSDNRNDKMPILEANFDANYKGEKRTITT